MTEDPNPGPQNKLRPWSTEHVLSVFQNIYTYRLTCICTLQIEILTDFFKTWYTYFFLYSFKKVVGQKTSTIFTPVLAPKILVFGTPRSCTTSPLPIAFLYKASFYENRKPIRNLFSSFGSKFIKHNVFRLITICWIM